MQLLTIGHGTLSAEKFAKLIIESHIALVVDVRSVPKSARHPHFSTSSMERWVPQLSPAEYCWEKDLGGFRRPLPDSKNMALRHPAFRGYADYMESRQFADGFQNLINQAGVKRTAIMCSESVWWRCHRRLIADCAQLLDGAEILHLMHDGALHLHIPTAGVRILHKSLRYDVGSPLPLPVPRTG